jgi:hypothetical protein
MEIEKDKTKLAAIRGEVMVRVRIILTTVTAKMVTIDVTISREEIPSAIVIVIEIIIVKIWIFEAEQAEMTVIDIQDRETSLIELTGGEMIRLVVEEGREKIEGVVVVVVAEVVVGTVAAVKAAWNEENDVTVVGRRVGRSMTGEEMMMDDIRSVQDTIVNTVPTREIATRQGEKKDTEIVQVTRDHETSYIIFSLIKKEAYFLFSALSPCNTISR